MLMCYFEIEFFRFVDSSHRILTNLRVYPMIELGDSAVI